MLKGDVSQWLFYFKSSEIYILFLRNFSYKKNLEILQFSQTIYKGAQFLQVSIKDS